MKAEPPFEPSQQTTGAIVIAPPWPFGSSNIFAAIVRNYSDLGHRVCLLLGTDNKTAGKARGSRTADLLRAMSFEGADLVTTTTSDIRRRSKVRAFSSLLRRDTRDTLMERARYIEQSDVPDDLRAFIDTGPVAFVHANHCFNIPLAERVRQLAEDRHGSRPLLICETHDIQAKNPDILGLRNPLTFRKSPAEDIARTELELSSRADLLIHLSPHDFDYFSRLLPNSRHAFVPPTLAPASERALVSMRDVTPDAGDLVYVGTNNFWNIATVMWLLEKVLPQVPEAASKLAIYGLVERGIRRRRPDLFRTFRHCFRGAPASITDIYAGARAILTPALGGTGTSVKLIEAMCSGRPVLATSGALRGLSAVDSAAFEIPAYDNPEAYAGALKALMADPSPPSYAGLYDRHFSNAAQARSFAEALG